MKDRGIEQIAVDVIQCALGWEPDVRLIGNVKASEIALLASMVIDTCPKCGSTAWVNIDCDLCLLIGDLKEAGNAS